VPRTATTSATRSGSGISGGFQFARLVSQAGELPPEVLSYPEPLRFAHGAAERAAAGPTPVGATDATPR